MTVTSNGDEFEPRCGNCKFYEAGDFVNYCLRYPPQSENGGDYPFPKTKINWWCGEWQPLTSKQKAEAERGKADY